MSNHNPVGQRVSFYSSSLKADFIGIVRAVTGSGYIIQTGDTWTARQLKQTNKLQSIPRENVQFSAF